MGWIATLAQTGLAWRRVAPPFLLFAVHCIAAWLNLYERFPWLDLLMHLAGGFAIAWYFDACLDSVVDRELVTRPDPLLRRILVFALVGTTTVFWEFAEFAADRLIGMQEQRTLEDTLADMALGIVGGVVFLARPPVRRS